MKLNSIIIFGSSRKQGNTWEAIQKVQQKLNKKFPLINLADFKVGEFDYEFSQDDDFSKLTKEILQYDLIIIASPVYWYSVSAKMKCFIDRFSDLLLLEPDLGRRLRGKKLAVITSYSVYPEGMNGFEQPLKSTSKYLGMTYLGMYSYYVGTDALGCKESEALLNAFIEKISH